MSRSTRQDRKAPWVLIALGALAGLLLLLVSPLGYRPDRPVPTIAPGSSPGPAFVVQIIRPRLGLPLGGILPPGLFGQDSRLVGDSTGEKASMSGLGRERIELRADDWDVVIALDGEGGVTAETRAVFEIVFEERVRRVRCRPGEPPVGTLAFTELESGELAGRFDIELARCEDAGTGESLGWPPGPLVLHGSFDRLRPEPAAKRD